MFEKGLNTFTFHTNLGIDSNSSAGEGTSHSCAFEKVCTPALQRHSPLSLTLKPQQEDKGLIYAENASTQAGQVRSDVGVSHKKHPRARGMIAHTIRDPYHSLGYRLSNLRTEGVIPRSVSVCDNKSTRSTDKRTNGITRPHKGMSL